MKPQDFGINVPADMIEEDFCQGFSDGMAGKPLTKFKLSYRMGFRTSKLLLRDIRKKQGIISFPKQGRIKMKAVETEF